MRSPAQLIAFNGAKPTPKQTTWLLKRYSIPIQDKYLQKLKEDVIRQHEKEDEREDISVNWVQLTYHSIAQKI